ncbi:MAG: MerR family transcriptional regulator [Alphaproteobacteria bacterium]
MIEDKIEIKDKKSDSALRTIGEVAQIVGVPTHVLRFWEEKFPSIKPFKNRGRRYFNKNDISVICEVKNLLYTHGYSIKGVQNYFDKNKIDLKQNKEIIINENLENKNLKIEKLIEIKQRLMALRDQLLSID